jgi:hypothetical protein
VAGEQKTEIPLLTSEQDSEQTIDFRLSARRAVRPGLRLVPGNAGRNLDAGPSAIWPVVSNLALAPALTNEQENRQGPLLTSRRQVELNQLDTLLTSEQIEEAEKWLWSPLPKPSSGWWDVDASGKGFVIKQRWRVSRKQETQTYPRVSREQFLTLKGMNYGSAKETIADTIAGHLDDIIATDRDRSRRDKARRAAARLDIAC